jgi:hypothetical protein
MSKGIKSYREPTQAEIAACAQHIYEAEGRPEGKALQHWLEAEAQLIAERKADAGLLSATTPNKPFAKPKAVNSGMISGIA